MRTAVVNRCIGADKWRPTYGIHNTMQSSAWMRGSLIKTITTGLHTVFPLRAAFRPVTRMAGRHAGALDGPRGEHFDLVELEHPGVFL